MHVGLTRSLAVIFGSVAVNDPVPVPVPVPTAIADLAADAAVGDCGWDRDRDWDRVIDGD